MIFQYFGLVLFLSVIPVTEVLQARCSGNQITWINESGQMTGCSPCPACPPGSEFSIPCSTKAVNGTPAKCIACPPGKFSNQFNSKPCVACTRCSKRYIKKVCSLQKNAVCGGCKAGYYYDKVSFSCEECGRCCKDGKDEAPMGCARVGMCRTRPYGCPKSNNTSTRKKSSDVKRKSLKKSINASKISTPTVKFFNLSKPYLTKFFEKTTLASPDPSKVNVGQDTTSAIPKDKDTEQYLLHLTVGLLTLIAILLFAFAAYKIYAHITRKQRPILPRCLSYPATTPFSPVPSPEDRTLEDFVKNHDCHDDFESVCVFLYDKRKNGMWDFERVAVRFGISREERIKIRNAINIQGENPTRELVEVLCSKRPKITVRQFAEIAKNIKRNDVYEKLEPFFSN